MKLQTKLGEIYKQLLIYDWPEFSLYKYWRSEATMVYCMLLLQILVEVAKTMVEEVRLKVNHLQVIKLAWKGRPMVLGMQWLNPGFTVYSSVVPLPNRSPCLDIWSTTTRYKLAFTNWLPLFYTKTLKARLLDQTMLQIPFFVPR